MSTQQSAFKDMQTAFAEPPKTPKEERDPGEQKTSRWIVVTGVASLLVIMFLAPLLYMVSTSIKSEDQISDPKAPQLWPASPATITYQDEELDIYEVPREDGSVVTWALLQPGRQESTFVDPADPEAGEFVWVGNWRLLEPAYEFDPHWENFPTAWNDMDFLVLFRNTMVIAGLGTIGAVASSIIVAYGLARYRIPGKGVILLLLVATIILPRYVMLVPTYALFYEIGWVGTWLPLIVPHFFANAFNVFLLRQYFLTIPKELDEAATIDGAGSFRTLWSVLLPQMKAAIVAVSLFHFFYAWNDFFEPMIYLSTRRDLQPISVGLQVFNSLYDSDPHLIQAGALMGLAIPVLIFLFAQRIFLKGIDLSGVQK